MSYPYGFIWGNVTVTRIASSPTWGSILEIESQKQRIEIRVTASGIIRVGKPIKKLKTK